MLLVESEVPTIAFEAASAMPQSDDSAFPDRLSATRIVLDQRAQHLAIPAFGMLDVENGMESEIETLLSGNAESLQARIDEARPRGRSHLDHPKRADRVKAIAPASRQSKHRIAERYRFRHDIAGSSIDFEIVCESFEQRTVHGTGSASAHFVPIVSRHLELGGHRHLDLRKRQEIVEAGFAGNLLRQEPEHVGAARILSQPRKKRVALSGPRLL